MKRAGSLNKVDWYLYLRMLLILVCAVIIGSIAMIVAYSMPTDRIRWNVYQSVSNYEEGDHPEWANGKTSTQLDCFTDSLILNTAVFKGTGNVINDAMENYYLQFLGHGITDSLPVALDNNMYDSGTMISYARYWHGHLAIIKPLLVFFSVSDILTMNMVLQLALLLYIAVKIYTYYGFKRLIALMLPLLILNPITIAQSFQYSQVYLVILFLLAGFTIKKELSDKAIYYLFFLGGIMTAYFDLLTYPMVALGIPLIFVLSTQRKSNIWKAIKISLIWVIGFAGMWAGKWIISSILTGQGVIENAMSMIAQWTEGGAESISYGEVLLLNSYPIREGSILLFAIGTGILLIYTIIRRRITWHIDIKKTAAPAASAISIVLSFELLLYT